VDQTNVTRQLALWVAETTVSDLPDSAIQRTRIILLDAIASALAGRSADETPILVDTAVGALGGGDATLLSGGTGSLACAAVVNGYLITAVTVCDIHLPTVCHVTPEVVPPALAIAEERDLPGADLLLAIALGLEVTTRIGLGTDYPAFQARGWHSPGITGPFGASAAVGKLMGLDADAHTHAFGICASQAAGTWAQLGTPTIKFQQARGAMSGLLSALLAERKFTATPDGLGAARGGLFTTYADGGSPDRMLDGIGARWELENISLRSWPAAAFLQGLVTAVLGLVDEHDVRPESVARLRVRISPAAYALHGERVPKDRFEARLTANYVAAVTLHDRACWMDQFSAERFADPDLTAWRRDRVEVISDDSLLDAGAALDVELTDGRTVSQLARVPKGDPEDAHTFEDAANKLRLASAGLNAASPIEELIRTIESLETVGSIRPALRGLRGPLSA